MKDEKPRDIGVTLIKVVFAAIPLYFLYLTFAVERETAFLALSGFLVVVVLLFVSDTEKKRGAQARVFEPKARINSTVCDLLFEVIDLHGQAPTDEHRAMIATRMREIRKDLMIWAGEPTIRAWNEAVSAGIGEARSSDEVFGSYERLFQAIRKDLGHVDHRGGSSSVLARLMPHKTPGAE